MTDATEEARAREVLAQAYERANLICPAADIRAGNKVDWVREKVALDAIAYAFAAKPASVVGGEVEDAAWAWLDSTYANIERGDDPADRAFSADEMVDAFIRGRETATPPIASPELVEKVARSREAIARVSAYITAYEDAPSWAGPIIYPPAPSTKDLRAILALTTGGEA